MSEKISVIIPVYNRAQSLKQTVQSVLDQTYRHFELIIIDDASEDGAEQVIKSFSDDRIFYYRNSRNMGVSASRNRGISLAGASYIAFLDSDDLWLNNKLQLQMDYFKRHNHINVVHTEEIWIRSGVRVNQKKKHKKSGGDIFIPSLALCLMSPSSIMMRKTVFEKYGYFDEDLIVCEDYDLWLRITAFEPVGFIETPLIKKFGGHDDQLSRKYPAMDRFRLMSLLKLINVPRINAEKLNAVKKMIVEKTKILLNGALKRNKAADAAYYKEILNKYII